MKGNRSWRWRGLHLRTWTHNEGRSRQIYLWLPNRTIHLSLHRKAA